MSVSTSDGPADQALKVLYTDLDGTLLGPGGSLFAAARGMSTGEAAAALLRLRRAGVELVLMSGRTRRGLHEVSRALGASAYIAELGGLLIVGADDPIEDTGAFTGPGSLPDALARAGVAGLLLERFPGHLEPVAPWTEVSVMFQGFVDVAEAGAVLEEAGFGWLYLRDNGRLRRRLPHLDVAEVRAYHLLPRGVSKASAVLRHRELRGLRPEATAAVGDSLADLEVAEVVGRFFLVANGLGAIADAPLPSNAVVTDLPHGDGFAEAVRLLLGR
ncbi:MAG TPA: HAD hydrolase family protein [Actinomycetota bacterium]|nr:HAD hydrolase family protein [Actinomycetota bacterium]